MANKLCIFSYNTRGFSAQKQLVCQKLVTIASNKIPIICTQETFILRSNSYKINKALPNFHIVFKAAKKDTFDKGRPKNGMFIALPSKYKEQVTDISPDYWRVQAVTINCGNARILLINSYFPVDSRNLDFNDNELLETIASILSVIDNNDFSDLIWCGDINADFIRATGHVQKVTDFVNDLKLTKAWDFFEADLTCVHEINDITYLSKIDHFFWNSDVTTYIEDCGVLNILENDSDHLPIYTAQ